MVANRSAAIEFVRQQQHRYLAELQEFVRIPSVSTSPDKVADMLKAAEWVAAELRSLGVEKVQVFQTPRHPVVFGELLRAGKDRPTVLVYGHYDVQPAEPLEKWVSAPFEPAIRGDYLFGRGASDMKGQVVASFKAIEAVLRENLPINVKFLIEGEEEIGSPSLAGFMRDHAELLTSDVALNPDSGMIAPDIPTIVYALRGLGYFEINVHGPSQDLHSGLFGGVVHNPAQVLCDLVAGMHDAQGRVTLPGFYDKVLPLDDEERAELARLPITDDYYLKATGAPALWGEEGYTAVERNGARPTLEVCGLYSGYIESGSKTVLPSYAMAKISTRLVPHQDPNEVRQQLIQYMEEHAPKTVTWEVLTHAGGPASLTDRDLPATRALASALETVWGTRPVYKREGGSIPVVAEMQTILNIESVLTGFGLPDDNIHSPNERLHLPTWFNGIEALVHFFYNLYEN